MKKKSLNLMNRIIFSTEREGGLMFWESLGPRRLRLNSLKLEVTVSVVTCQVTPACYEFSKWLWLPRSHQHYKYRTSLFEGQKLPSLGFIRFSVAPKKLDNPRSRKLKFQSLCVISPLSGSRSSASPLSDFNSNGITSHFVSSIFLRIISVSFRYVREF